MKKYLFILIMFLVCSRFASAQVICVLCYDQNDSISQNVNNLILNGGFENNNCVLNNNYFCPNSSSYNCDIVNWTCVHGGWDTYSMIVDDSFSIIVEGTQAAYFGNDYCYVCSITIDDTSCINHNGCILTGIPIGYPRNDALYYGGTFGVSLEQTVTGLVNGDTYVLEFWVGGEEYFTNNGVFAVDIGFGNIFLQDKATPPSTGIGTRYIIEFNATSTSHTIKFTNWGHICSTCTELVLDNVRLYTLAELSPSVPACVTSTNELDKNASVKFYPNPFTNELSVTTVGHSPSEIILYDITSRKLLQQTFTNTTSINTAQLAKGIYLYEVRDKDGVIKKGKVVKQ